MRKGKGLKIISLVMIICLCFSAFSASAMESSEGVNFESKIMDVKLREAMDKAADDELIEVWIFLCDIDHAQIAIQLKEKWQERGYPDIDDVEAVIAKKIVDEVGYEEAYRVDQDRGVSLVREAVLAAWDEYEALRRLLVKEACTAVNDKFIADNIGEKERAIRYIGGYTTTLIIEATRDEIISYAKQPEVAEIGLYEKESGGTTGTVISPVVTLSDAQRVLKAALNIATLPETDFLWEYMADGDRVTLNDAQRVLKAALNIISLSEDVTFKVTTDKSEYQFGDDIEVTVRATNVSDKTIYPVATSSTSGAAGSLNVRLQSEDGTVVFQDIYYNKGMDTGMYYGTMRPGETIEWKRIIHTSQPEGLGWNTGMINELPPGGYHVTVSFTHTITPQGEDAEPYYYTCPVAINPFEYDVDLEATLKTLYKPNLVTKILLAKDTEDIPVRIEFDSEASATDFKNETFGDDNSKLINHLGSTLVVRLTHDKLISMAETSFPYEVELH